MYLYLTKDQINAVLEIHHVIVTTETLSLTKDFVRLFNSQFPEIKVSLSLLKMIIGNEKVLLVY